MPVSATATSGTAVKVFVSYAHEDEEHCQTLKQWLAEPERNHQIQSWTDHRILPGEPWDAAIRTALEEANLILLLVSQPFIASGYIQQVELKSTLARVARGKVHVVPILIRTAYLSGLAS